MKKTRANSTRFGSAASARPGDVRPLESFDTAVIICTSEQPAPQPEQRPLTQEPSQYAPPGFTWSADTGRERENSKTNRHTNRLIIGLASIQNELIAHLSRQAEIAYTLRQLDKVEAIGRQLEQIHAPVARFWQGLAAQQQGKGNLNRAQKLLEYAASQAPRNYQARALFILGSVAEYRGDYKAEAEFYHQALSLNTGDLFTTVEGNRALAIRASIEGDRRQAISLLERTLPLAHYYRERSPYIYLQSLNSLATEYREAGRLQEALTLARIVCASPLARIYPEFGITRDKTERKIQERERATVIVVVSARPTEQRPQPKVIIRFQYVESRARRRSFKPTIGRAPVIRSIVERVATVAPIHAPPFRK
jgi:tetratricopeptide (TPR) repeat protein